MTPSTIPLRRPLRALRAAALILAAALAAAAGAPSGAGAHVTPAQAEHAAERGANWFLANQEANGQLSSDWAMTALAAVDVNAADARTGLTDPSAQDFYLGDWQANGPGGAGTDAARGILAGVAGGIQTSRLGTAADATKSNLVARLAELWDGTQIGAPGLLNDDVFGLLALHHAGAPPELLERIAAHLRPEQLPEGSWSWSASSSFPDTDMTGAAIAALCAAGATPADPDVQEALAFLRSVQDPASGGFAAPPPFGVGVNADSTAWVASGLIQCGIDPQGPEWTTAQGKTPLDYLVSLQRPDGHFDWTAEIGGGAFETYSSVRPLAGAAFSSPAPARLDGVSPALRPAEDVAAGTTVPITLAIDHGPGADDVRMCRVDVASGSGLGEVLDDAEAASTPAGCVAGFGFAGGELATLNGVAATGEYGWSLRIDGAAASAASAPIGFGDLVFLDFAGEVEEPGPAPEVEVPALVPTPTAASPRPALGSGARVKIRGRAGWNGEELRIALACPPGLGEAGCRGLLSAQFRSEADGRLRSAGSAPYAIASGERAAVAIRAGKALRRSVSPLSRLRLRFTAATRDLDGAVRLTRAKRYLRG